jgi:type IV pilus assembly protein PilB
MAVKRIGQILVDMGFLTAEQVEEVLGEQRAEPGRAFGRMAVDKGYITDEQVGEALAKQLGMPLVNLRETSVPPSLLEVVPETMASVYKIVPLTLRDNVLTVAMADPQNLAALDDLRNFLGYDVQGAVSSEADVQEAINRLYGSGKESIEDIVGELEGGIGDLGASGREGAYNLDSIEEMAEAAPVRKLLNMVLLMAIKDQASDVHFEPFEDEFKIRIRADGVLYEMVPPPRHLALAITSRIKVMANLDIAERRLPQDGRIELNVGGNPVDLRVSVLPTMFGESVVIRVLDRTVVQLDLNKIGMDPVTLRPFRHLIQKPNGIVLVTGPTGSGKTTTLYSALNELNQVGVKIITTEDPVEYDIDGIVQIQINSEIGVTFSNCLRSILRHDPDIILVGEIRDLETAEIAVQSSLTGHLVFSTLHTNDAPTAITRLTDLGMPSFLITASLEGVLAQRLVRRICVDCRTEFEPSDELIMELGLSPSEAKGRSYFYGRGCERCNNTGYKGRVGIFELMIVNDDVRDLIMANASADEIRSLARSQGMVTLRDSGLKMIFDGVTTIDEVVRETLVEEEV